MKINKTLLVKYHDRMVGTLAAMENGKVAFEYTDDWLETGFSVSPFSLPLEKKVFIPPKPYFGGLFGVFADSLPDAWGNMLVNRMLKKRYFLGAECKKVLQTEDTDALDELYMLGGTSGGARPKTHADGCSDT